LKSPANSILCFVCEPIKPEISDIFILAGIFKNTIKYFVVPSNEISTMPGYKKGQHRGTDLGIGSYRRSAEGWFKKYEATEKNLISKIKSTYKKIKHIKE
jgi:hypothetical protein